MERMGDPCAIPEGQKGVRAKASDTAILMKYAFSSRIKWLFSSRYIPTKANTLVIVWLIAYAVIEGNKA